MKKFLQSHKLYLLTLTVLVIIVYFNSLNNAFLSDDIAEIRDNPNIGNLWYAITSHPFGFIRLIFYWIAYQIGGLNPIFFRLINLFFHLGSATLIYSLIFLFYNSKKAAFLAAAAFAVHPAISEAVVWISGGSYPQYTFFFLLSLLFYFLSSNNRKIYLLSIGSYILSLMSHPVMPLSLFLVYPIFEYCFGNLKKNWLKSLPFLIISIVFVITNLVSLPERVQTLQTVHYQEKGIDNPFILIPIAVSSYLELIFFPKTLTLYHSELAFSPLEFSIRALLTLLIFILTILSFKKSKIIFFWLSLFWLSLAPTLTPFRLNWIVAERYLYLPSIGLFTLIALGLSKLSEKKKYQYAVLALFTIAVILLSARTIFRNIDWKNEDNLWIATGKTSPSSPNTHNNLGDVYGRQGDKQRALQEFQTAIALKPNYADAYHNLANTYMELNQADEALENYQKAIEFNPNLWQSYQNIAAIFYQSKQYDKSIEFIQKAILVNPKNVNLRINLGVIYLTAGEKEKAKEIFNFVLSLDPQNQIARQGLIEAEK